LGATSRRRAPVQASFRWDRRLLFTPISSSWLDPLERFFADLTGDVIRVGSFASVNQLARDINAYLAQRNAAPKPTSGALRAPRPSPKSNVPRRTQQSRRCIVLVR
jgi:hypothetical protein